LNEAFKNNPELENKALESAEPIFVKNLENVQGDERDVILFSMGYGPDKEGKISLNFGPLNRDGGWRRLNVAITRARMEMKVFSTLRSDQIDITRTSSEGVAGIKSFLEYSEKGKAVLVHSSRILAPEGNSIEKIIAKELEKVGLTVNTNIGCSGYKIDIGIVNPNNKSEYVLGILTDGNNYRSAETAKDREIVQTGVLGKLGWNIYKLWTPDWWDNSEKIIKEILLRIEDVDSNNEQEKEGGEVKIASLANANTDTEINKMPFEITQEVVSSDTRYEEYNVSVLEYKPMYSEDFLYSSREEKVLNQIIEVLENEAPISDSLLSKRILNAYDINRQGVRLKKYLDILYRKLNLQKTKQERAIFYWNRDQDPETFSCFRVPKDDESKRNPEDLPKEEISAGVIEVLSNQISLPEAGLVKEAALLFGYSRLGTKVESAMKLGIHYALERKLVIIRDERILLP
jgi:hypothetical protein